MECERTNFFHLRDLQGAQNHIQAAFQDLQGSCSRRSPRQLVPVLHQKYCLVFRGSLSCTRLCPLPLVLPLGTSWKSLALPSLYPPFRYLRTLTDSTWASSSTGQTVLPILAFSHRRGAPVPLLYWWTYDGLFPVCPCFAFTGEPRTGPSTVGVASPTLRGRITSLDLKATLWLMQPGRLLTFFAMSAHSWLMLSKTPSWSFSAGLLSSWVAFCMS